MNSEMSDLSYVHPQQHRGGTAARDTALPADTSRPVAQEWSAEQIQQRLLNAAEEESERVRSTTAEARRWKDEHDKMAQASPTGSFAAGGV
jgi:hypothetical protein